MPTDKPPRSSFPTPPAMPATAPLPPWPPTDEPGHTRRDLETRRATEATAKLADEAGEGDGKGSWDSDDDPTKVEKPRKEAPAAAPAPTHPHLFGLTTGPNSPTPTPPLTTNAPQHVIVSTPPRTGSHIVNCNACGRLHCTGCW